MQNKKRKKPNAFSIQFPIFCCHISDEFSYGGERAKWGEMKCHGRRACSRGAKIEKELMASNRITENGGFRWEA